MKSPAIVVPAPGLFSTITCWPSCLLSGIASARQHVGYAAGGEAHHQPHRLAGVIGLRRRRNGPRGQ
jgi:hypothetical protein